MSPVLPIRRHLIASNTVFHWDVFDSSSTQVFPPGDTNGDKHRSIVWEPGGLYASTKKVYMRKVLRFRINSSGRTFNFHNHPYDAPDGYEQTGPDGTYTSGVSAVACDWYQGQTQNSGLGPVTGYLLVLQPQERGSSRGSPYGNNRHWQILSESECVSARSSGQLIVMCMELTMGFANSTPKGAVKIWVNGEATPRINIVGVNTQWLNQGAYTLWEGGYDSSVFDYNVEVDHVAAQLGRTPAECIADSPAFFDEWGGSTITGSGVNSSSQVGTYDTSLAFTPAEWNVGGGGGGTPPPTGLEQVGPWSLTTQWQAGGSGRRMLTGVGN